MNKNPKEKESPYPQADITKYKNFQRAENKANEIAIRLMAEKNKIKKKSIRKELVKALKNLEKEAKIINDD